MPYKPRHLHLNHAKKRTPGRPKRSVGGSCFFCKFAGLRVAALGRPTTIFAEAFSHEGEILAEVLARRGLLPLDEAVRIIYQALLALQYLDE